MARIARAVAAGFPHHVVQRGNNRENVFIDDEDREKYIKLLKKYSRERDARILAYCLMSNHVHLLVQVADIPLSRIMQNVSFRYTRWFNWRQGKSGHLFQGRYKAVLVDADEYLLELVRYLHLNPVRAGITTDPLEFPWSSHRAYCGRENVPWL